MSVVPEAHAVDVIQEVRLRLEATGGWVELWQLAGMSVDELERLVEMELGITLMSDA